MIQKDLEDRDQILFRVPAIIKEDFQVWCLRNKTSMQEVLERYVKFLLKKRGA